MGHMSYDRVKFYFSHGGNHFNPQRDAALKAFNMQGEDFHTAYHQEIPVICRPSQFARFLIFRNENGGSNSFKELRAELFIPSPRPLKEFDVSFEQNKATPIF